jgi:hypothetical protein
MNDLCKIDLNEIKNYMLYTTSIKYNTIDKYKELIDNNNVDSSKTNSIKLKKLASVDYNKMQRKYNEKKKLFYEDKLFWCFYKLYKNMEDIDIENLNIMKEEKDFKINIVNKIHNNKEIKDLLKKHKFKKNLVEDELLNSKKISLTTFECLVMLHSMDVFIIKNNNSYTYFNYNNIFEENDDNNNSYEKFKDYNFIIFESFSSVDKKFELNIENNVSNLFIKNIIDNYYYLENLDKPIKAFSSYKLDDLINICNKLKITIYNDSKKKTKKELYEEIDKCLR